MSECYLRPLQIEVDDCYIQNHPLWHADSVGTVLIVGVVRVLGREKVPAVDVDEILAALW